MRASIAFALLLGACAETPDLTFAPDDATVAEDAVTDASLDGEGAAPDTGAARDAAVDGSLDKSDATSDAQADAEAGPKLTCGVDAGSAYGCCNGTTVCVGVACKRCDLCACPQPSAPNAIYCCGKNMGFEYVRACVQNPSNAQKCEL